MIIVQFVKNWEKRLEKFGLSQKFKTFGHYTSKWKRKKTHEYEKYKNIMIIERFLVILDKAANYPFDFFYYY